MTPPRQHRRTVLGLFELENFELMDVTGIVTAIIYKFFGS
jgi:hypothetical protein